MVLLHNNDDQERKVTKLAKSQLSLEDRMNAEFKHLRKRIQKLEAIVLSQEYDAGSISSIITKIDKG